MTYKILPSLLAADGLRIHEAVSATIQAGADFIHLDVMDNHYVPNLTFGPGICQSLRQAFPTLPIDVHLMITPVDDMIKHFATAGATRISIHPDATHHSDRSLQLIRELNCQAGLVLNPATSVDCIRWIAHRLDFIVIMTVNPGFGGQTLIPDVIEKITDINQKYPDIPLCVDGGVTADNIGVLARAGATEFIAGSSIFNHHPIQTNMNQLRKQLLN